MDEPDSNAGVRSTSQRWWLHTVCVGSFFLTFVCCCFWLFVPFGEHRGYVIIVGYVAALAGGVGSVYLQNKQESREDWLAYWLGCYAMLLPIQLMWGAFFAMFGSLSVILFLLALQTVTIVRSYLHWKASKHVNYREVERGDIYSEIVRVAGFAMSVVVLAFFFRAPLENFPDGALAAAGIGIKAERSTFECLSMGVLAMLLYFYARMSLIPRIERIWSNDARNWAQSLVFFRMATPRGRFAVWLARTRTVLIAIFEEVLFRGVFVLHLDEVTGNRMFAIAFGLMLFLAVHTYHGFAMLFKGVVFYACVVGLLYSPYGLLGAIGLHVAWNYSFVIGLPKNAFAYRRYLEAANNEIAH